VDFSTLKDWDREAYRLAVANQEEVDLDLVALPGDSDPSLNIVLRLKQEAEEDDAVVAAQSGQWNNIDDRAAGDDLPDVEDMMFFDALDGSIDASWDIFGG